MSKIRIYISCHENSWTPDSTILTPVQVGAELIDAKYDMIHDNDGPDNISCLNRSYCELTAQYWAWKNDDSDYCGFMHYRRYFIFNESVNYPSEPFGYVKADRVDTEVLKEFKITDKNIETCVDGYDVIVPKQGSTGKETIYEQYKSSHNSRDFDVVLEIIRTRTPEIYDTALEYVNGDHGYFCNMFIMRRELFQEYSKWLFSIMDEFDKTVDCSNYNAIQYRVNGYLAERLCGIYLTYLINVRKARFKELQWALFSKVDKRPLRPIYGSDGCVIVLAADDNYVKYLSVLLESIKVNSKSHNCYDIIILNRDICADNRRILTNQFADYHNFSIRFVDVSRNMREYEGLFTRGYFQIETYYRLLIQDILPGYHKALYLDSDMVVNRDVADLFSENIDGYYAAACRDPEAAGRYNAFEPGLKKYVDDVLKMEQPYDYFQAGAIVFNLDEMRNTFTAKEMMEFALSKKWNLLDQDVLNVMFKSRVKLLDMGWNVMYDWRHLRSQIVAQAPVWVNQEYLDARKKLYIIHYAGSDKPWTNLHSDLGEHFWKYARQSPFYELLQAEAVRRTDEMVKKSYKKVLWMVSEGDYKQFESLNNSIERFKTKISWIFNDNELEEDDKRAIISSLFCGARGLVTSMIKK